jgi:hypothetical protein
VCSKPTLGVSSGNDDAIFTRGYLPVYGRCEKTTTEALSMADKTLGIIDNLGNVLLGFVKLHWQEILYLSSSSKIGDDSSLLSPNLNVSLVRRSFFFVHCLVAYIAVVSSRHEDSRGDNVMKDHGRPSIVDRAPLFTNQLMSPADFKYMAYLVTELLDIIW